MDLRHVLWIYEADQWVRASSKVFSCYPEAKAHADTLVRENKIVIVPLALEAAIMVEGINRGADLVADFYKSK